MKNYNKMMKVIETADAYIKWYDTPIGECIVQNKEPIIGALREALKEYSSVFAQSKGSDNEN